MIRWIWPFLCFMVLGALAVYAIGSLHSAGVTILVLLAPLAVLAFPAALRQAAEGIRTLIRSLTWWQGLWLLLFLSDCAFRQRTDADIRTSLIDAAAIYRVALVGITGAVLAVRLAVNRPPWLGSLFRGLVGALTCYCAISVISTLWSVFPAWTLYKSLEYLVDVALLAAVLATVCSAREYANFFTFTWALYGLLLISVWLGVLLWPREAWQTEVGTLGVQLFGVLPAVDANSVGEYGAILAIVSLSRLFLPSHGKSDHLWYGLICTFGLTALVLSQTRSAIAGFLVGAILLLLLWKGRGLTMLVLSGAAGLIFLGGGGSLLWKFLLRGQSLELFGSLSGRLNWWEFGWKQILKSPWVGFGAYTGRFQVLAKLGEVDTSSVHNTFLEVVVGVGIVGLVPLLVVLLGAWWSLIRSLGNRALGALEKAVAVEALGVLAVLSVRSLFTTHLIWHPSLQFLVVLGYAEFLRRRLKHPREHPHLLAHNGTAGVRSLFTTHLIWHPSLQFPVALGYAESLWRRLKHPREHPHLLAHYGTAGVRSLFTTHLIWRPSLQFSVALGYAESLWRRLKHPREHPHLLAHYGTAGKSSRATV
jgi:O-antigen ligase